MSGSVPVVGSDSPGWPPVTVPAGRIALAGAVGRGCDVEPAGVIE